MRMRIIKIFNLVGEAGLEPAKPEGSGVTVHHNCHYVTLPIIN